MRVRTLSVSALIAILLFALWAGWFISVWQKIRHMKKKFWPSRIIRARPSVQKGRYPRQKRKHAGYQPEVIQSGPGTEKYPAYRSRLQKMLECTDQIYGP